MKELKAVIFDLDGTLLNTLDDLADSMNQVLSEFGFPKRTKEEIRLFVGNGVYRLVERALFEEGGAGAGAEGKPCPMRPKEKPEEASDRETAKKQLTEQVFLRMKEYYSEHCCRRTAPYPGIAECLDAIAGAGLKTAVVSNKLDGAVKELVRRYFPEGIGASAGDRPGLRPKPAPDLLRRILSELAVEPEECLYVGDSEVDLETAANVGIPCLSVCWGFRDREFLKERGAVSLFDTAEALTDAILIRKRAYDCLLFDLDGTLTNPEEGITKSAAYALRSFGLEAERGDLLRFIGPPLADSFREFYGFSPEQAAAAVSKYRERYQVTGIYENFAYEGMKELLAALKEAGYLLGVATSKPEEMAYRVLEKYELLPFFDVVTGSEMDGSRARKSEVIEEALLRLRSRDKRDAETGRPKDGAGETNGTDAGIRRRTLMIGDRKYDIAGAKEAGLASLGVRYGFAEPGELTQAGADYIAGTVEELGMLLLSGRRASANRRGE